MQAPLEPMQLPLDECMQNTIWNKAAATTQPWPVRPVNTTGQTVRNMWTRLGLWPVRSVTSTGQTGAH
jgi:hypothetical protein